MEKMRPFKNLGGGIRRVFDMQVCSTYHGIRMALSELSYSDDCSILDVGCGAKPYRDLFPKQAMYKGIDTFDSEKNFDYKQNDVTYYDGITFPVKDNEIDLLFHSEVMEHIYDTRHFLQECARVLKKGGQMIFTVPFQARYHYIPYDYWRFTPSSIESLLSDVGFYNIKIHHRGTDVTVAGYKVLALGYRLFFSKSILQLLLSVVLAPIWVIALVIGQISIFSKLGSKDDCLGYVVTGIKK